MRRDLFSFLALAAAIAHAADPAIHSNKGFELLTGKALNAVGAAASFNSGIDMVAMPADAFDQFLSHGVFRIPLCLVYGEALIQVINPFYSS
jgi:hypothetical protein